MCLQQPYFGGERLCGAGGGEFDPSELLCGGCVPHSADSVCRKHGTEFIEFKCRFCCGIAVRAPAVAVCLGAALLSHPLRRAGVLLLWHDALL